MPTLYVTVGLYREVRIEFGGHTRGFEFVRDTGGWYWQWGGVNVTYVHTRVGTDELSNTRRHVNTCDEVIDATLTRIGRVEVLASGVGSGEASPEGHPTTRVDGECGSTEQNTHLDVGQQIV